MTKKNGLPIALVMGDIELIRCLGQEGIGSVCLSSYDNPANYSRYCNGHHRIPDPFKETGKCLEALLNIASRFKTKPVLFYGGDTDLLLISRNRRKIAEYCNFIIPSEKFVESFINKRDFIIFSKERGLPIPKTCIINTSDDFENFKTTISFPAMIKPFSQTFWFNEKVEHIIGRPKQKAYKVDDSEELETFYNRIKDITPAVIIQEYIRGRDEQIYSFHGYFDRKANLKASYIGRKIRTFPIHSGTSCYIELIKDSYLNSFCTEILQQIGYTGAIKIDLKKDILTNQYKILEFNPRFNLWNYLGARAGINLPYLAYQEAVGEKIDSRFNYIEGIRWLDFKNDFLAFLDYHKQNEWNISKWFWSLLIGKKVYHIFCLDDPKPFLRALYNLVKRILYRLTHSRHRKSNSLIPIKI